MEIRALLYQNFAWRGFFYFTSLLLNIAVARVLGAELSGGLYFFLNNLYISILIGSMSLDAGIIYFASRGEVKGNNLASFSLLWSCLVSLIIAGLFFFFYINDPSFFRGRFLFLSSVSFILGTLLYNYFNGFFYSKDDYKTPNLVSGIANLILFIFIPWHRDWLGFINNYEFIILFFIVILLQGIVIAFFWFKYDGKKFFFSFSSLRDLSPVIKYSLTALTGNIVYFILYRIDYWFVEYYCSAKSLGNYIQVSRLGQLLIIPCTIIAGTLFPQSSKNNFAFNTPSFRKLFWLIFAIYSFIGVMIFLAGKPVILFFWGNEYDEMFEPLLFTLPGILFLAISYLFSPVFAGTGKVKLNVLVSLFAMIIVIICNFLLVPLLGINGAAIATSAGFLTMMVLNFIFASFGYKFSLKNLLLLNDRDK